MSRIQSQLGTRHSRAERVSRSLVGTSLFWFAIKRLTLCLDGASKDDVDCIANTVWRRSVARDEY